MVGPELRGANIGLQMIMANREKTMCQSKIVCTLGPACWDVDKLEELMDAGLSVARFNFSHGDHAGHKAALDRLRTAAANKKKHVGKSIVIVFLTSHAPKYRERRDERIAAFQVCFSPLCFCFLVLFLFHSCPSRFH